ncbi:MAG: glycosyltransferase family 2 protein [Bacteroides sp.]|nr:glycosyltransferase family 2 protein [Bacteroides sp.]
MKRKITLGIPIYNAANLVEKTLLSALNQTYPNIEYLFVDDKGDSMDVVRRVVENHPRSGDVRIIDQGTNQGIAVARNTIIENATGDFLFTMDCDDVILPNCIEILYSAMMEHPVDFVAASFVRCDVSGKLYPGCQYEDILIEGRDFPVAEYRYGLGKHLFVATWNKLYDMDFLRRNKIRCHPGHYNEDPWFTYQVILNAASCRLLPDVTLHYIYNPQSVSGIAASNGYSEKIAYQFAEIQQLKSAYVRPLAKQPFYINLLVDIMQMSIYHAYRIATSSCIGKKKKDEIVTDLLQRKFVPPLLQCAGRRTTRYRLLSIFWKMPMWAKVFSVKLLASLRFKEWFKKWLHFTD